MTDDDFGFALPAFDADSALLQLKRALRDLKLGERGGSFERRGKAVLRLAIEHGAIAVQLAQRPTLTPTWDRLHVRSAAEQRKLLDELERRLRHWQDDD